MTDTIHRKIAEETSEAVLRALRSWCLAADRWRDDHQTAYEAQIPKIKARWAERRGK